MAQMTRCYLPVIGLPYHDAPEVYAAMVGGWKGVAGGTGVALRMLSEPTNAADGNAVLVELHPSCALNGTPHKIGYVRKDLASDILMALRVASHVGICLNLDPFPTEPVKGSVWLAQVDLTGAGLPDRFDTVDHQTPSPLPHGFAEGRRGPQPRSGLRTGPVHSWF